MNRDNLVLAIAAIMIVLVAIGGISVYFINPYSYDSDVRIDADNVEYSIEASNPIQYNILVLENLGILPTIESLIICSDDNSYSERVKALLDIRGFNNVEIVDPGNLLEAMIEDPSGRAILMPQGPFPEEVYSGGINDPLLIWLDRGGSIYWFGYVPEYGYMVNDSIMLADDYLLPFGLSKESFCTVPDSNLRLYNELSAQLCFRSSDVVYGLRSEIGKPISYVSDSGFSAISSMQVRNGAMIVLGGGPSNENLADLAQIIASGITHNTKLIGYDSGIVRNTMTDSISYTASDKENVSVYIHIGGYYTVYGKRF